MQAFDAVRAEHNGPAQKALNEANAASSKAGVMRAIPGIKRLWTNTTRPHPTATSSGGWPIGSETVIRDQARADPFRVGAASAVDP